MLEQAVMEYAKWFLGMLGIMFIIIMGLFMFRMNEINSFQQDVNHQIERHGGLTDEAKRILNEKAKMAYGGCIVESPNDGAACLFAEDRADGAVATSGFFIREYITQDDGTDVYYDRGNTQARYGTTINYALTRRIGDINGRSFFKPSVLGTSASRVLGTASAAADY